MALRFVAVWTLTVLVLAVGASEGPNEIEAKPGDKVTLRCRGPRGAAIRLLEWRRSDLNSNDYVFFYRENRSYEPYQHQSFRGRVELRDPEMKDGDFSVILKNVTISDTGTFQCYVSVSKTRRRKRAASERICSITLTVQPDLTAGHTQKEENKDGRNRHVGLGPSLVLVGIAVCFVIVTICKIHMKQDSVVPPSDEEAHLQPA